MKPDYEKQLKAEIDARLKELDELTAPATLAPRVMRVLERRAARPWYRRAWQTWPVPLQAASALVMIAAFTLLCFGAWQFTQTAEFASVKRVSGGWLDSLGLVWRTLNLLANSVLLAVKSLGPVCIAVLVMVALAAYAACLGLGTVYVRLVFVRR